MKLPIQATDQGRNANGGCAFGKRDDKKPDHPGVEGMEIAGVPHEIKGLPVYPLTAPIQTACGPEGVGVEQVVRRGIESQD